jgi:hypothetical protein
MILVEPTFQCKSNALRLLPGFFTFHFFSRLEAHEWNGVMALVGHKCTCDSFRGILEIARLLSSSAVFHQVVENRGDGREQGPAGNTRSTDLLAQGLYFISSPVWEPTPGEHLSWKKELAQFLSECRSFQYVTHLQAFGTHAFEGTPCSRWVRDRHLLAGNVGDFVVSAWLQRFELLRNVGQTRRPCA